MELAVSTHSDSRKALFAYVDLLFVTSWHLLKETRNIAMLPVGSETVYNSVIFM
jgi:hypothetical protein